MGQPSLAPSLPVPPWWPAPRLTTVAVVAGLAGSATADVVGATVVLTAGVVNVAAIVVLAGVAVLAGPVGLVVEGAEAPELQAANSAAQIQRLAIVGNFRINEGYGPFRRSQVAACWSKSVDAGGGVVEEVGSFGFGVIVGEQVEGVPEGRIRHGAAVDGEVALQHAPAGAEGVDSEADIIGPPVSDRFGCDRVRIFVPFHAVHGHADNHRP